MEQVTAKKKNAKKPRIPVANAGVAVKAVVRTNQKLQASQAAKATKPVAKKVYLTKRVLLSAVNKGFSAAAAETMEIQGYNVIAEGDWVIKVYADGTKERIKKIAPVARPANITLH